MPTTRSASKKQTSLEEYGVEQSERKNRASSADKTVDAHQQSRKKTATKRKSATTHAESPAKKSKTESNTGTSRTHEEKNCRTDSTANDVKQPSIIINRSPVLQLWAAVVAGFLHPNETWETCLSIGGAISTLCAISKGRAIGKVEPKDKSAEESRMRDQRRQQSKKEARTVDVMGFELDVKDDMVMISGKPKPVKEGLLQGKFGGEEEYSNVRQVMENALRNWSDDKEQLDKKAFHMYEKFRPGVAAGSSGWGRKGELHLKEVKDTIEAG